MSFESEMRKAAVEIEKAATQTVRATALQLFTQVIERTPVGDPDQWESPAPADYIGGTARGNWQSTTSSPAAGELELRDEKQAIAEVSLATARFTLADHIYLANNLPYIQRLEDGWSGQAPAGMVAVTINNFQQAIEAGARKHRI